MVVFRELVGKELGLEEFFAVRVIHCTDSFGLVMKHKNGWKVVYEFTFLLLEFSLNIH